MKTTSPKFRFRGGVHPEYRKELSRNSPIERLPLAPRLCVSMSQHLGAPAKCIVKAKDRVAAGQLIGERNGFISANVHSPAAGTVVAVEPRQGPAGNWADAVIIDVDPDQSATPNAFLEPLDWRTATADELRARIDACGLCGMGGAGFPSAVKLSPPPDKRCEFLVLNGAECEPYLTSDFRVMAECADKIRTGTEILRKILGGPAVRIAIEANKPEAVAALEKAFADIEGDVEIVVLPVVYPQGSEKHQIYAVTGRRVAPGALPISVGCVVENVATVAAAADAVALGKPLFERVTTVSGDGVANPKNILAAVGTPYADLIAFAGGETSGVRKIVSGGPMMGFNVSHTDIPTAKTTSGLLLLTDKNVFQYTSAACINCGNCLRHCPMQLNPAAISRTVEANDVAAAEKLGVMNCIECGACSFGCPAYRDVTQHCRRAKASIRTAAAAEAERKARAKGV